jgi:hypothetical protein
MMKQFLVITSIEQEILICIHTYHYQAIYKGDGQGNLSASWTGMEMKKCFTILYAGVHG